MWLGGRVDVWLGGSIYIYIYKYKYISMIFPILYTIHTYNPIYNPIHIYIYIYVNIYILLPTQQGRYENQAIQPLPPPAPTPHLIVHRASRIDRSYRMIQHLSDPPLCPLGWPTMAAALIVFKIIT